MLLVSVESSYREVRSALTVPVSLLSNISVLQHKIHNKLSALGLSSVILLLGRPWQEDCHKFKVCLCYKIGSSLRKPSTKAGEMTQWVRVLAAKPET